MISQRVRESKRVRAQKLPKNIERAYRETKCRDCAVVVTRMDFAKILGKFTKVKIQFESSSTPKTKKNSVTTSPISNSRLKSNENGMVLLHRNAYSQHPVKELLASKKPKGNTVQNATPRQSNNVLKENNRLKIKKTPIVKDKNSNINITSSNISKKKNVNSHVKQYRIIFVDPSGKRNKNDLKSPLSLTDLLPLIDKSLLPTEEWAIDFLPRKTEPMDDKVYDRIAAELEDLMYNEKSDTKIEDKTEMPENKVDEFPSIMDILNDNSSESSKVNDQNTSLDFKANLESSDVEAMLLGKSTSKELETALPTPMEVDNTDMSNLIEDVAQLNAIQDTVNNEEDAKLSGPIADVIENPHSPSILDEALQKGIEEHLPSDQPQVEDAPNKVENIMNGTVDTNLCTVKMKSEDEPNNELISFPSDITHLIFKKNINGNCIKSVTCPKNLKYCIELEGKTVEFLGAPTIISSVEDLQVLLQIVNETDLQNLYVYH